MDKLQNAIVIFGLDNSKNQPVLNIKLPADIKIKNNTNLVLIAYNIGLDVYEYSFINNTRRKLDNQIIHQINEVYADDLIQFFEEETGLYCYL